MAGIGGSRLTKKAMKEYQKEAAQIKTKEERLKWLSEGECDAIMLTNINTMEENWYPMINGFRFFDGDPEKVPSYKSYDDAFVAAVELKKKFGLEYYELTKTKVVRHASH